MYAELTYFTTSCFSNKWHKNCSHYDFKFLYWWILNSWSGHYWETGDIQPASQYDHEY